MRFKRNPYDWSRGSSSQGEQMGVIIVDDSVIDKLTPKATSSSAILLELPTIGSLLKSGTASRATVVTIADDQRNVPAYLATIKRITGFSWEKIGLLLNCTRQTVYNWTQGETIKPENVRQVAVLHETISYIDRGSQAETAELLETEFGGRTLHKIITDGEFPVARRLAGKGSGRPMATWTKMQTQKPSGRQEHWTDRVAAQGDEGVEDVAPFAPNKVVKKIKFKLK